MQFLIFAFYAFCYSQNLNQKTQPTPETPMLADRTRKMNEDHDPKYSTHTNSSSQTLSHTNYRLKEQERLFRG